MSAHWLPAILAASLGAVLANAPIPAAAQSSTDGFQIKYSHGRGDRLVLKTMNREELLDYILDNLEESLLEYGPLWTQEGDNRGRWNLPISAHNAFTNDAGQATNLDDCTIPFIAYGLLILERDKPVYAGKYPRAVIVQHLKDYLHAHKNHRQGESPPLVGEFIAYVEHFLETGQHLGRQKGKSAKNLNAADRRRFFEHLEARPIGLGAQGGSAFVAKPAPYRSAQTDITHTENYLRHKCAMLHWFSTPRDWAARWLPVDDAGPSLAELFAKTGPRNLPDYSTIEHGHWQWTYISRSTYGFPAEMFAAATAGRKVEEVPPPFNIRMHPELSDGFRGYLRDWLRKFIAACGSLIWPDHMEKYEQLSFAFHWALDATVNQDPVSAAYLSREIQRVLWQYRRPLSGLGPVDLPNRRKMSILPAVYYLVKHWGLPKDLPDWAEAQARTGGVTYFAYNEVSAHLNPFKVLTIHVGNRNNVQGRSVFRRSSEVTCQFSPTPWREGHTLEFLQQFANYDDKATNMKGLIAKTKDGAEISRFEGVSVAQLKALERELSTVKTVATRPILGDYGDGDAISPVDLESRRVQRWDDGMRVIFKRGSVTSALFSLGGRMTAIIEESPKHAGKLVPMNFWVKNLHHASKRTGAVPKVSWNIHLPEKMIPFADLQEAKNHQEAVVAKSSWYNIDDLLAVAIPEPLPLVMGTRQFADVRDRLYFGPAHGGSAVIYSGALAAEMPALAREVKAIVDLPAGWKGITALAPEGYRIYAIAKFAGGGEWTYAGKEPEGAPVFSLPTRIEANGASRVAFRLPASLDCWSEEPHFYIARTEGTPVIARGDHHRLELTAEKAATVTVRFFGGKKDGPVVVTGTAGVSGNYEAAHLRGNGLTVSLKAGQSIWLAVTGTGALHDDRIGPYVDLTEPFLAFQPSGKIAGNVVWQPIRGRCTFKADAADRSGVAKVEFYLNSGQLIGVDTQAPFECTCNITDTFIQTVYAVAHDNMGNSRKSFYATFGDGTVGPRTLSK